MTDTKESKFSEQETVEIALDDNKLSSRKSSTSTSSFEEREITDVRPLDQEPTSVNVEPAPGNVETFPKRPPRGVALTFKTTSLDDPTYYSQSSLASEKSPKTGRAKGQARVQGYRTSTKMTETDRDPEGVNDDIKVLFEEVFAEPEGAYSFGTIWGTSYRVFTDTKLWCYRFLSAACAIPCALCWGVHFACLSFVQIWLYTPGLRSFTIQVRPFSKIFFVCAKSFIAPCFEAFGKIFSSIKVHKTTD